MIVTLRYLVDFQVVSKDEEREKCQSLCYLESKEDFQGLSESKDG